MQMTEHSPMPCPAQDPYLPYTPPVVEVVEVKVSRFCGWSYEGDIEDWEEVYF